MGIKRRCLKKHKKQGIELGSWFETPLHGNEAPLSVFAYEAGSCPNAERACEQVINLPTHIGVDKAYAENVLSFLREYAEILCRHAGLLSAKSRFHYVEGQNVVS